jgi:hypothetical protein
MLEFALKYREAIEAVTSDRRTELRKYELSEDDWGSVQELCSVLEVSSLFLFW